MSRTPHHVHCQFAAELEQYGRGAVLRKFWLAMDAVGGRVIVRVTVGRIINFDGLILTSRQGRWCYRDRYVCGRFST